MATEAQKSFGIPSKYYPQEDLYPKVKRRKANEFAKTKAAPVSGCYEGKFLQKKIGQATLELKIDVDQIKEFSKVLNVFSGTIVKSKGQFLRLEKQTALYFRSLDDSLKINRSDDKSCEIICDVKVTRNDDVRFYGLVHIQLRFSQANQWEGTCKVQLGDETVTFECIRKSEHFRKVAIDIDYVDDVIWPSLTLSDYYDTPQKMKDQKIDPYSVFATAGVKLIYDPRESDKGMSTSWTSGVEDHAFLISLIADPTPNTPWTKNDMYDLMMANFDQHPGDIETMWCMMANKPPDYRYMGYSFDKNGRHGFGLFLDHKTFEGLRDKSDDNHIYAKRQLLFYLIHECGHSLGLEHVFDLGKPHELTWMNYAWRYDNLNGPGKFFSRFHYCFSNAELGVIRHSPHKLFKSSMTSDVQTSSYGVLKSLPSNLHSEEVEEEEKDVGKTEVNLSLRIKIRKEPFRVNELIELEIRIKNEGSSPTFVQKDLSINHGYVNMHITYPDGKIKNTTSFVRPITGTAHSKPLLLYPGEDGMDRLTQLISVGEGRHGAHFNISGQYQLQAIYTAGGTKVISNKLALTVVESRTTEKDENIAFSLGSTSQGHTKSLEKLWRKICSLGLKEKMLMLPKIISIADEVANKKVRVISTGKNRHKIVKSETPAITYQDFLSGTEDLCLHCHKEGKPEDNLNYKELVMARVKILIKVDAEKGQKEFGLMISDLVCRGVKYSAIKEIMQDFEELQHPKDDQVKDAKYFQKRVEDILDWFPGRKVEKKDDLSGIGLGEILIHFDNEHVFATSKIVRLLFAKLEETNDLDSVFDYADNLQKSFKVNHEVLHWAVEVFIIHSPLAKKKGIMYPQPPSRDATTETMAAMVAIDRSGNAQEHWMDYWRSDGDLNYHHRHWHSVYVVGREIGRDTDWFGRWRTTRPELERQGELFAYMHQQMLARYDAERGSWGLNYVQGWQLDERDALGYNAGFEFHNHGSNVRVSPRPPAAWPLRDQSRISNWEQNYQTAVDNGVLPGVTVAGRPQRITFRMDFNLAGHVLEASSTTWNSSIGSIHNNGHVVFGTNQIQDGSYMLSTASAMRDPIFYRWHKRVDNLWQRWNETQLTELAEDAPPVRIRSNDILMRKSNSQLNGFASFQGENFESDEMTTFLGPPILRFERDNKISHDPFFYHIRFRRTAPGDLNLTFRIFICPLREVNNRQMWIEMDKFVYRMPSSQDTGVIIRPDRHSSVIKREPGQMQGDVEAQATNIATGFCECGWPYSMLLPRGTSNGEQWRVCVFVSDNNEDGIAVRSSCGSLSFCGASGQQYPDVRPMGYPFTTDVSINGSETKITDAIDYLPNAAMSDFVIRNNVVTSSATPMVDVWSPWVQLNLNDGTIRRTRNDNDRVTYSPSRILGRMRVLVDDDSLRLNNTGRISIRFQGRGSGNGAYRVTNAAVTLRNGTSLNIVPGSQVSSLSVQGQRSFEVPEFGAVTDEVSISRQARDLFVTFTLTTPGCFLRGQRGENTSTWVLPEPRGERATSHDWNNLDDVRLSPSIYCVGAVMSPVPR